MRCDMILYEMMVLIRSSTVWWLYEIITDSVWQVPCSSWLLLSTAGVIMKMTCWYMGANSISHETSYRKISQNLTGVWSSVKILVSLWNLAVRYDGYMRSWLIQCDRFRVHHGSYYLRLVLLWKWHADTWGLIQYRMRRLIVRSPKISQAFDRVLKYSYRFEIWQVPL